MGARSRLTAIGCALLLVSGMVGCTGPAPAQDPMDADAVQPIENSGPGAGSAGSIIVDPAWPWPSALPRPSAKVTGEFTGPNILGEGGIYSLEFTVGGLDEAQDYADALAAAGITWMFETFPEVEPGETETSVVALADGYMASLTVDTDTLFTEFSLIGDLE